MAAYNDHLLQNAKDYACRKLNLKKFKAEQNRALDACMNRSDAFISLPTGFGKSIVFQGTPLCFDYINENTGKCYDPNVTSLAIVIVPLKSLALDQVKRAELLGIEAAAMVSEVSDDVMDRVCQGGYSLLFASPEVLLSSKGKELLMATSVYHRLCSLFVDESHCVVKWGQSSGSTEAFRKFYGMIAELRSIIKLNTPVVAMTATATQMVRSKIVQALGMHSFVLIDSNPLVQNIKHIVTTSSQKDYPKIFDWLCDEIADKEEQTRRVLIFCQSRKDCSELYSFFCSKLPQALHQHFNMYHTNTENDIQVNIVKDFADANGKLRVLFSTIAFGLGVDVKGVHTVIMYGTPSEVDDYIQLCGRGGRDGLQSLSITLRSISQTGRTVSKEMKEFTKTSGCRREILYKAFSEGSCASVIGHNCCDNCSLQCSCVGNRCSAKPTLLETKIASHQSECEIPVIQVSDDQYQKVRSELKEFQLQRVTSLLSEHIYSGTDLANSLPSSTINHILANLHLSLSYSQFCQMYTFPNVEVSQQVWAVREKHLNSCCVVNQSSGGYLDDNSEQVEESDDEEYFLEQLEYCKIHVPSSDSD